ncbi:GDSL-type esterase/lipase family protein, partial [Terriglobus sp. YAF25]|uniref:SGNH/GDSL hydrolase family protein n=1 Tax=Terriglobus sp. YAF25 TaxID=3233080 RepID=UPI003F953EF3
LLMAVTMHGQTHVVNAGFGGRNTAELEKRFAQELAEAKPAYVVLFAGTNDALNDAKFLTPLQTREHLTAMVQQAQAAGAAVVLVTVHDPDLTRLLERHRPEAYGILPPLERVAQVNAVIEEVARTHHAAVVPFHDILQQAGGASAELSTDGVHLTAKGYGMLAAAVRSKLPPQISPNVSILCMGDSLTYGIGVRPDGTPESAETYPAQLRALLQ